MADSLVTTLLENIRLNLRDSTTYTALGYLKTVDVVSEFVLYAKNSPYAVIVAENPVDQQTLTGVLVWWQPVTVYIVNRRQKTPDGDRAMLGDASLPGLDTLAKDARQALCRPSPYNPVPTVSYTTLTGVLNTRYGGMEYRGVEEGVKDEAAAPVVAIHIDYLCVEAR